MPKRMQSKRILDTMGFKKILEMKTEYSILGFTKEREEYFRWITRHKRRKIGGKRIYVWTDGSCPENGKKKAAEGGIGVFFGLGDKRNVSDPVVEDNLTNIRAELWAIHKALEVLLEEESQTVELVTDSEFSIRALTCAYKTKMNLDIFEEIVGKLERMRKKGFQIVFRHQKGHKKKPEDPGEYFYWYGNNWADSLAGIGTFI